MKITVTDVRLGHTGLVARAQVEGPGGWIRFVAFPIRWGVLKPDDLMAAAALMQARARQEEDPQQQMLY